MCMEPNISVSNLNMDHDQNQEQNKTIIIDDGRIYKSPFTFSLINLLPKCRQHSSLTFSLFTAPENTDPGMCIYFFQIIESFNFYINNNYLLNININFFS